MVRNLLTLLLAAGIFWLAADWLVREQHELTQVPLEVQTADETITPPQDDEAEPNLIADISVHSVEELEILLTRVDHLLERPRSGTEQPLISLVLHGPEVEFFALKNYDKYKSVVDHAAKLAALGAVEVSICQTQMRNRGIGLDEVPAFLKQVPFGPDEVDRLVKDGFVYM